MRTLVVAVCVCAVVVTGCSSGSHPTSNPLSSPTAVGPASALTVNAGGGLSVTIAPGELATSGSLTVAPATGAAAASVPVGLTLGPAFDIHLPGTPVKPVTVSFAGGSAHPGMLPTLLHYTPSTGWYPVAVGPAGGTVAAARTSFSPYQGAWWDPRAWAGWTLTTVRNDVLKMGTTGPTCGTAPRWATTTTPERDRLLSCVADTDSRAVVKVKNNRGLILSVTVPVEAERIQLLGQSLAVTEAELSHLTPAHDDVLLGPGDELDVAFTRPVTGRDYQFSAHATTAAVLADALSHWLGDPLTAELVVADNTFGVNIADNVSSKTSVTDVLTSLAKWAAAVAADPLKATLIAQQVVAWKQDRPLSVISSDSAFTAQVDVLEGRLLSVGKIASVAFASAELATQAAVYTQATLEESLPGTTGDPSSFLLQLAGQAGTTQPVALAITTQPVPPFPLPGYRTSGGYPQVTGTGVNLTAVNAALRAASLAYEKDRAAQMKPYSRPDPTYYGTFNLMRWIGR